MFLFRGHDNSFEVRCFARRRMKFHSLSPWLFDVNILRWPSEIRELFHLITESSRYQLQKWMLHFATCYVKRTKMPKNIGKCRWERKPNQACMPYLNTAGNANKIKGLRSIWHFSTTKLKFFSFISRAYTTSSEFVKELVKRGLHYTISLGQFDHIVRKKCLAMVSQELSIVKSLTKEYVLFVEVTMVEMDSYPWDVFRVLKMKPEGIFLYKNGPELIS